MYKTNKQAKQKQKTNEQTKQNKKSPPIKRTKTKQKLCVSPWTLSELPWKQIIVDE